MLLSIAEVGAEVPIPGLQARFVQRSVQVHDAFNHYDQFHHHQHLCAQESSGRESFRSCGNHLKLMTKYLNSRVYLIYLFLSKPFVFISFVKVIQTQNYKIQHLTYKFNLDNKVAS